MRIYMKDRSAEFPVLSAVAVPVILTVCTGFETGDGHGRSILPCFMAIIGERAQKGQLPVQYLHFSIIGGCLIKKGSYPSCFGLPRLRTSLYLKPAGICIKPIIG